MKHITVGTTAIILAVAFLMIAIVGPIALKGAANIEAGLSSCGVC